MYLIKFQLNFAVFRPCVFVNFAAPWPREISEALNELRHLHYTNWWLKIGIFPEFLNGDFAYHALEIQNGFGTLKTKKVNTNSVSYENTVESYYNSAV